MWCLWGKPCLIVSISDYVCEFGPVTELWRTYLSFMLVHHCWPIELCRLQYFYWRKLWQIMVSLWKFVKLSMVPRQFLQLPLARGRHGILFDRFLRHWQNVQQVWQSYQRVLYLLPSTYWIGNGGNQLLPVTLDTDATNSWEKVKQMKMLEAHIQEIFWQTNLLLAISHYYAILSQHDCII